VLEPPATPHPSVCTEFGEVNGICVTGQVDPVSHENGPPVTGTRVGGFLVRHFSRFGILLNNAIDTTISDNVASHNRRWGIAGFILTGIDYLHDASHDNGQGGFYIADSPDANALVIGNRAFRNAVEEGIGLFFRDASHGLVRDNDVRANCAGIWFLDAQLPGPATDWVARDNIVRNNTAACPPSEDIPVPLSGLGIALLGTARVLVQGNLVTGNQPTGDTPFAGGIVLASSLAFGGADPTDNLVRENLVRNNDPADLVYDGSGSNNRFIGNDCRTSVPDGLCR
jgi:nitrous oxidase accessory protein NosD